MTRSRLAGLALYLAVLMVLAAGVALVGGAAYAEDFDWRNVGGKNWVTSVKDQFSGTCWDFAACGVLEAKYMLTRNDTTYQPNVSEQQVCWEGDMGDTGGGRVDEALDYFRTHGVVLDSECPNDPNDSAHWDNPAGDDPWPLATGWQNRVFKCTSNNNWLAENTNLNFIKNCLKQYGPLSLRMRADSDFYIPAPGDDRGGHVVVIVGYHDDASVPGGGYWIIKNSWGPGWNRNGPGTVQDGYGAISYASQPSYEPADTPEWWEIWKDTEHNRDVCGITGAAYYTGAMATVSWKGGSGPWQLGAGNWTGVDQYGTALPNMGWQNSEISATFNATSGRTIALTGTIVAHELVISAGATGYVFNATSDGDNDGALTVTGGGINAGESVTINAPVTIGAPQTWTVAQGKCLTINGNLHTIISGLTITGVADTVVTGSIDGGGALNLMGAAPGKITLKDGAYLWLNGEASYSVDIDAQASSHGISFSQPADVTGHMHGKVSGGGWIDKRDRGTIVLHAANNYTNWTSIYDGGAVQADSGVGLPAKSVLNLNGGVLQSNSEVVFTRSLGTSGDNRFFWQEGGGGFAGGAGPMTVRINNGTAAVTWGATVGSHIVGTLKFGSTTAANTVTWENVIDLNAEERTISVEDNPDTDADLAIITGVITDSQAYTSDNWTGAIRKTGPGTLVLTARNENGEGDGSAGNTTIAEGVLQADRGLGLSGWAGLILDGGVLQSNTEITFTDNLWSYGSGAARVRWIDGGFSAGGGKMTVNLGGAATPTTVSFGDSNGKTGIAGLMKLSSNTAHFETELRNGLNLNNGARTIQVDDNPFDTSDFATITGAISGTGSWTKTGSGTLYLSGSAGNTFNGTTTVTAGTLRLNKSSGLAVPGNLALTGNGLENNYTYLDRSNQIATTATITFVNDSSHSSRFNMLGHTQTVAGIICSDGRGVIQNTERESGVSANGVLTVGGTGTYSYNGYLRDRYKDGSTGKIALVKNGSGTQTLAGENIKYTGGTTISGGRLVLQNTTDAGFLATGITTNSSGTLEFNAAGADFTHTGVLAGSGAVQKTGSYRLTLGGSTGNTHTGTTTVTGGRLDLDKSTGVAIGGNLSINATTNTYVYLNRDEQIANSAVVSFANNSSYYSRLYLQGHTETVAGISDTTGRGLIQNGNLIVNGTGSYTYAGYLRNYDWTTSLAKQGSGTLTLSGSKIQYTGGTTISGGKLILQDTTNSGFLASPIAVNGAMLEFNTAAANVDFTGTIAGTGAVRKTGSYKLALGSAGNSYTGATTVVSGVLAAVSTAVRGPLTIQADGAFAPGNVDVIGSVSTGMAACQSGGEYLFEINDANGVAGTSWDFWNIGGNMSIGSGFTVSVSTLLGNNPGAMVDFDNTDSYSWLVAQTSGTIAGFANLALDVTGFANPLDPAGYLHLTQSANAKQLFLTYSLAVAGDTNHDNRVDDVDAAALAAHWGQSGGWADGDFNDDGRINAADAAMLAANWGHVGESYMPEYVPVAVPEPGTFVLLVAGLFGLMRRVRHTGPKRQRG